MRSPTHPPLRLPPLPITGLPQPRQPRRPLAQPQSPLRPQLQARHGPQIQQIRPHHLQPGPAPLPPPPTRHHRREQSQLPGLRHPRRLIQPPRLGLHLEPRAQPIPVRLHHHKRQRRAG